MNPNVLYGILKKNLNIYLTYLYFFCHTDCQDHFQCSLSTCEGSCVDGEVAELVLFAKLCSMLQLWHNGNGWRGRQTETSLCERQKLQWAGSQYKEQLDSYLFQAGVGRHHKWICTSLNALLLHIPTFGERYSCWWSRPASPGCSQGLPVDCCLYYCRTAVATGGREKAEHWALSCFSPLLSHIFIPVSFILHHTAVVSVCGQQPNAMGMKGQGLFK